MQLHALKCGCLDFVTNMCSVVLPSVILLHPIARKQSSRRVSGEMLSVTFGVNSSVAVMAREGSIVGLTKVFVVCIFDFAIDVWGPGSYDGQLFSGIGRIGYNQ